MPYAITFTSDMLEALAHVQRSMFSDDMRNKLTGYLVEIAGEERYDALTTVNDLVKAYWKGENPSLGSLWQATLLCIDKESREQIQAAILHMLNERHFYQYDYWEGGKPLHPPRKNQ